MMPLWAICHPSCNLVLECYCKWRLTRAMDDANNNHCRWLTTTRREEKKPPIFKLRELPKSKLSCHVAGGLILCSWLWFTRRQVSESIIRFPRLKPLAGPERPFVKSQLVNVSDPSLFRGSGNPKSSVRREQSFGFAAVSVMGIVSGRPM